MSCIAFPFNRWFVWANVAVLSVEAGVAVKQAGHLLQAIVVGVEDEIDRVGWQIGDQARAAWHCAVDEENLCWWNGLRGWRWHPASLILFALVACLRCLLGCDFYTEFCCAARRYIVCRLFRFPPLWRFDSDH